jgi:hypothetical protein
MHQLTSKLLFGALALGPLLANAQQTQSTQDACGSVYDTSYGPYDYRKYKDRIEVQRVEQHHFTTQVENLTKAMFGKNFAGDFDYTLHAIPNHHRALASMTRHSLKIGNPHPRGARLNVDCYFVRAMRFTPDDMVVRQLYADYLIKLGGRTAEALQLLEHVTRHANGNAFTVYNSGLLYFETKEFAKARKQAQLAAELGLGWPALREKLAAAGQWEDAEPAASAASGPGDGAAQAAPRSAEAASAPGP